MIKVRYKKGGRFVFRSELNRNFMITVFGDKWIKLDRVNPLIVEEMKNSPYLEVVEIEKDEKKVKEDVKVKEEKVEKKKRGRKKKKE